MSILMDYILFWLIFCRLPINGTRKPKMITFERSINELFAFPSTTLRLYGSPTTLLNLPSISLPPKNISLRSLLLI